jgi:hypothetical protein
VRTARVDRHGLSTLSEPLLRSSRRNPFQLIGIIEILPRLRGRGPYFQYLPIAAHPEDSTALLEAIKPPAVRFTQHLSCYPLAERATGA